MVNIAEKKISKRTASAQTIVSFPEEVHKALDEDQKELRGPKGPVFATAIIAGTMGVKRTSDLIPFCHPLPIDSCKFILDYDSDQRQLAITCTVEVNHRTGVEMEALTGSSIAALTIYDMCKALSHNITITQTRLLHKTGGKSDLDAVAVPGPK